MPNKLPILLVFISFLFLHCTSPGPNVDWPGYLGGNGTNQYSSLDQINTENVNKLKIAWTYSSEDADEKNRSQIQCNPLVIDGVLYGSTPTLKIIALDAANGELIWSYDPFEESYNMWGMGVNRGLAFWTDGTEEKLLFTAGSFLYSLNAQTGELDESFGEGGKVDLHKGLGRDISKLFIVSNSPGIVYKDLIILGSRVSESTGAAPGHIRAYDVHTGEIKWIFHTIPKPGETGHDTWPENAWNTHGGANAWSGMSLDHNRGLVFVPTGSAAFDFYGGDRPGDNLFANCLLALNAETGERVWHYQMVHHDLWDRDLPCPPNVVTIERDGKKIDAVAQVTKSSHIFLFDRQTGEPLFPINEVEVPPSKLQGEWTSPTQPIPTLPKPFARTRFTKDDITKRTPEAYAYVEAIWNNTLSDGDFIPPSEEGTIIYPGFDGGGEWGGGAFDPETQNLYINASEMPWILQMVPYTKESDGLLATEGKNIYKSQCQSCHGIDLKGASIHTVPSLVDVSKRLAKDTLSNIISQGKGMMPSFAHLNQDELDAIIAFLSSSTEKVGDRKFRNSEREWPYPYVSTGYNRFKDHEGYPATTPPWGTLNAINLSTCQMTWKRTLGNFDELDLEEPTGCENYGGPVVTAGGLLFIGATRDEKFRVFNKYSGELLYETDLPAAGFATPTVYAVDGKQYIVIACGGGKLGVKSGDSYIAFSL